MWYIANRSHWQHISEPTARVVDRQLIAWRLVGGGSLRAPPPRISWWRRLWRRFTRR